MRYQILFCEKVEQDCLSYYAQVTGEDGIIIGWFSVKILKISGYGVAGSRSHASSHIEGIPEPKVNQSSGGDSCYNCTDIAVTEWV